MARSDFAQQLKSLETRYKKLQQQKDDLTTERNELNTKIQEKSKELQKIQATIDKLKKEAKDLVVSEHAILRYLERVGNVNLTEVQKNMLPENMKFIGSGKYEVVRDDGKKYILVIRDNVVVTVEE